MGKIFLVLGFGALIASAQEQPAPAAKPKAFNSVIGEVTALDEGAEQITVKTDAGTPATVPLDEKTLYLRVPPGEKDLKKAAKISLSDIGVGDRVLARVKAGPEAAAESTGPAVSVMVMSKAELTQRHEKNRAEWTRRGVAGKISAIDPATKQVTLKVQTSQGLKDVIVEPAENVTYRRYAPDSVRFSDAKPSTSADLKVGDNMRVLGDKSEDGSRIKPEEIVSGTFRNHAGTVISVNAAAGELRINDLETKKPLTIKINPETTLKKLPEMMAQGMARMRQGGGATGPGQGAFHPGGDSPRPGAPGGPEAAGGAGRGHGGPGDPGGHEGHGMGRGNMDFQSMLERVPPITLSDLKPGDAVIVSSTAGSDPSRVTAITLVAGVEPLLASPDGGPQQPMSRVLSFDIGMPQ